MTNALFTLPRWERIVLALALLGQVAVRLPTLTGPLDHPDWRQTENAYAAYRMWQEPMPEVMSPKVPYRGPADVHLNELPLHALGVAVLYKLAGSESLLLARLFTLLTFAGACWGLYRILTRIAGTRAAAYGVVIYAGLPLSLFYSRAHHYDFLVMLCSFWFLDQALALVDTRRLRHAAAATLWASIAFLMKAPYCFYLWLPLLVWTVWNARGLALVRGVALVGVLGIVPLTLGMLLNRYRVACDLAYPESIIHPMQFTPEFLHRFFIGSLEDRLKWPSWHLLISRSYWLTFTPLGLIALAVAPFLRVADFTWKGWAATWSLVASHAAFVLIFFPMVASTHDYYSIPLLTMAAVAGGVACAWMAARAGPGRRAAWGVLVVAVLAGWLALGIRGVRRFHYFEPDHQLIEAGAIVREATPADAVVVCTSVGRSTGWSDPRMLYYARRRGWCITWTDLTPEKLRRFGAAGGTHLAVLVTPPQAAAYDPAARIRIASQSRHAVQSAAGALPLGDLYLYPLPAD